MIELFGGIEIGGTKTICAVGTPDGNLTARKVISTATIEETFNAVCDFFAEQDPIKALGVGTFGPLNIDKQSESYGRVYNSPKAGWENVNLRDLLSSHFKVPIKFDLDVNCAALGELNYGVAKEVNSFVYLTIGTGIGGSLVVNRQIVHGVLNLEMGHMRIPHEPFTDGFEGTCDYHGDCLEGIASGYTIQQRYGKRGEEIDSAKIWEEEATYIAMALGNIILSVGPEKVVLGGGILNREGLLGQVRSEVSKVINGYMPFPELDEYIVKSSGETNGVLGAIKLADLC